MALGSTKQVSDDSRTAWLNMCGPLHSMYDDVTYMYDDVTYVYSDDSRTAWLNMCGPLHVYRGYAGKYIYVLSKYIHALSKYIYVVE